MKKVSKEVVVLRVPETASDRLKNSILKKEIEKGLREVMDKFGDDRRTQILNLSADENDEPVEVKKYQVSLTNQNEIYVSEISSLYSNVCAGDQESMEMWDELVSSFVGLHNSARDLISTLYGDYLLKTGISDAKGHRAR